MRGYGRILIVEVPGAGRACDGGDTVHLDAFDIGFEGSDGAGQYGGELAVKPACDEGLRVSIVKQPVSGRKWSPRRRET